MLPGRVCVLAPLDFSAVYAPCTARLYAPEVYTPNAVRRFTGNAAYISFRRPTASRGSAPFAGIGSAAFGCILTVY